jgi:hypothetical protein
VDKETVGLRTEGGLIMNYFENLILTKSFPKEEKYSMTDQVRRSSRSVCANLAGGFRKRKYSIICGQVI